MGRLAGGLGARGAIQLMECVEQRLDEYLFIEDRRALEDEYRQDMQDAAARTGADWVALAEETPFEEWLRQRREERDVEVP